MDAAPSRTDGPGSGAWQAVPVPPAPEGDAAAGTELCALLGQLRTDSGLTYEQLAKAANMSRGSALNYITKPGAPARHPNPGAAARGAQRLQ